MNEFVEAVQKSYKTFELADQSERKCYGCGYQHTGTLTIWFEIEKYFGYYNGKSYCHECCEDIKQYLSEYGSEGIYEQGLEKTYID